MRREIGMFIALLLLCGVIWKSNGNFAGGDNVYNLIRQVSMLGVLAIGSCFVIVTGGIDLSVGSIVGLVGVIIAYYSSPVSSRVHADRQPALVAFDHIAKSMQPLTAISTTGYYAVYSGSDTSPVDSAVYLDAGDDIGFQTVDGKTVAVYTHSDGSSSKNHVVNNVDIANNDYAWKNLGQLTFSQGITIAMLAALGIGLVQGLLITRLDLQPFIVTLAGMLMIRGVSQTIVEGGNISFGSDSPFLKLANLGFFMKDDISRLPYLLVIFLVVIVASAYLLHFTVFGRYLYAIGGSRDASEYSGIPVKRIETISYVISAGLAGVAGVCWASYIGQMSHTVGIAYELSAIAACVLGGFALRGGEGTIIGVIIGTAVTKVIDDGLDMFQVLYKDSGGVQQVWHPSEHIRNIVIGSVILLAVVLDQVFHIVQNRRRIRSAGAASASKLNEAVPVASTN